MKKIAILLGVIAFLSFAIAGCATSTNADLDKARFEIDRGNWDSAINSASAVQNSNPSNIEAAILLSSAYAGRGGVRIVSVSADIAESENSDNEFKVAHDALLNAIHQSLVGTTTNLDDLRNSVVVLGTTLDPQPTSDNEYYTDQQYQLGMLETIEAFGLSSVTAQPVIDGTITPTDIAQAQSDITVTDMINADNHLLNGGMEETDDLVKNIRKNYCVLQNASVGATGFDLVALQDLNLCQLTPEGAARDALGPGDFQSTTITQCGDFNFDACENAPDTL